MWYLPILEKNLDPSDAELLKGIYEPKIVGVQPDDTRRGICVMPDGELRHYGTADKTEVFREGKTVYLSSRDCGLSWKLKYAASKRVMGSASRSPWSGDYVAVVSVRNGENPGTFGKYSALGPDDENPAAVKISDEVYGDIFLPVALTGKKRWLCTCHLEKGDDMVPTVLISDDDGRSWRINQLKSTPKHEAVWPHADVRWQNNGSEPVVTELPDGRLMLLARTSLDYLYVYYSNDFGDTWTEGEPSDFHCTLTTPFFLRLSDGRTLLFWNNTQPLPEQNHRNQWPFPGEGVCLGAGEDVFTNRDANHCAISDDGCGWTGMRELFLNEIRDRADFRVNGGILSSADKSVHQFQAIELPYGKILAAFGQHDAARRMVIFDVNWLYESSRTEDFQLGLKNVSTHSYVKSVSGCHLGTGFAGHCAWNRTNGPLLVPDPDATFGEALQLCRIRDPRLVSETQGMVWNYPAAVKGEIKLSLRIDGSGVRVTLCDHWYNPTDVTAREFSPVSFSLTADSVSPRVWHEIRIAFELDSPLASVECDGKPVFKVRIREKAPLGLSYLMIQSIAEQPDYEGTYIRRMEMNKL